VADILIVDDERNLRTSLRLALEEHGHSVEGVESGEAGLAALAQHSRDLVFLDVRLPGRNGMDILREIRHHHAETIVIMMSAYDADTAAPNALETGAYYFLNKPFELRKVLELVEQAMVNIDISRKAQTVRQIRVGNRDSDRFILGNSRSMNQVADIIAKVANSPTSTVLIQGESGTGKELVAKAVHFLSFPEERKPFLTINCAGLPETLLESELFGYEKGAFTDARESKRGLLEIADGGTLFLDEIGEMPLGLQARLLRVLETKSFRKVGGTRDIEVDVRIVAATNRDLKREAQDGRFRDDLYFRLNVVLVQVPPLRERAEDVLVLASYFVQQFNRELKRSVRGFTPQARALLEAYAWPGNVRELKNVIERAILLQSTDLILASHLPLDLDEESTASSSSTPAQPPKFSPRPLRVMELEHIALTLEWCEGNKSRAAKLLGISRQTLREKLKKMEAADSAASGG
jgi:DNA-binding NtrC family response regulator